MSQVKLRQTTFDVEPLRNVVGVGNSTAYQISVTRGRMLGRMGALNELQGISAHNDEHFPVNRSEDAGQRHSWFRRVRAR